MLNFCTLFDINFLPQGIAMYESLVEHCKEDFMLYIFAFCNESRDLLKKLNLKNVTVVSLEELENGIEGLKQAKTNRTKGEYCWTCASASILYCLKTYNLDQCTYIDADTYFYSNPKILLDEMRDKSILITEHRYTPSYDQTKTSGKYCVQFISFKNDEKGLTALNWWVNSCLEWCYNRIEDGKFGDQKYLDDWTVRFEGVHVLEHLGGGVAPWNIQQYQTFTKNKQLYIREKETNIEYPIIFFHFHNLKVGEKGYFILQNYNGFYSIDENAERLLYLPYMKKMAKISKNLYKFNHNVKVIKKYFKEWTLLKRFSKFRKRIFKIKLGKNGYLSLFGYEIIKKKEKVS